MGFLKPIFSLLLTAILIIPVNAQNNDSFVWAPVGATWHYSGPKCHQSIGRACDYYTIKSVKDTIFKGKTARILEWRDEKGRLMNQEIMMNRGDSVFYYDPFQSSFQLIFDFGVKAGDTMVLSNDTFSISNSFIYGTNNLELPRFRILIDSVKYIKTNGKLKKIYTTPLDSWGFKEEMIEKIGGMQFLFGYYRITSPGSFIDGGFRCYQDSSTIFTPFKDSCDHIDKSSGNVDNPKLQNNLKIVPNPFSKQPNLIIPNHLQPPFRLTVWNTQGKIVKEMTLYQNKSNLQCANLNEGIYFLRVKTKSTALREKLLKK